MVKTILFHPDDMHITPAPHPPGRMDSLVINIALYLLMVPSHSAIDHQRTQFIKNKTQPPLYLMSKFALNLNMETGTFRLPKLGLFICHFHRTCITYCLYCYEMFDFTEVTKSVLKTCTNSNGWTH